MKLVQQLLSNNQFLKDVYWKDKSEKEIEDRISLMLEILPLCLLSCIDIIKDTISLSEEQELRLNNSIFSFLKEKEQDREIKDKEKYEIEIKIK